MFLKDQWVHFCRHIQVKDNLKKLEKVKIKISKYQNIKYQNIKISKYQNINVLMAQYLVGCNIGARQISRSIINGQRQMGHMSLNLFLFGILA